MIKGLRQYEVNTHKSFKDKLEDLLLEGAIEDDLKVPQISESSTFKGVKLLVKKGLDQYLNHRAVSAVYEDNCVFSATIAAIGPMGDKISEEEKDLLYCMASLFNSKLFTYYLLMTSSSFGAGRNRVNYKEFLDMPFVFDSELSDYSKQIHLALEDNFMNVRQGEIDELNELIENRIYKIYDHVEQYKLITRMAIKLLSYTAQGD